MFFPQAKKAEAGAKIGLMLQQAEDARQASPHPAGIIDALQQKNLGTPSSPNYEALMPNVTPMEAPKIRRLIRQHIAAMGGGELEQKGFPELQKIKQGFDLKAKWDKTITSGEQQMHRNFSHKIADMIKEGVPGIDKPYEDFAKASNALAKHGGGMQGIVNQLLTGGGAAGYVARRALVYPLVWKAANAMNNIGKPQGPPPTNQIGFHGGY